MAENTKIEWTDHTFNPWIGCTKVSDGCKHCYAEVLDKKRFSHTFGKNGIPVSHWGPNAPRQRTSASNWKNPLAWNRAAVAAGVRSRVFCASLADVFDAEVPPEWRADLFELIRATPNLDWQLLTKRPENILDMLPPDWGNGYENVWLGTSVENQAAAHKRIWSLLRVKVAVRFLSCEPLLGPLDLDPPLCAKCEDDAEITYDDGVWWCNMCDSECTGYNWLDGCADAYQPGINWVITGGESGPGARPMHPAWVRDIRDQCAVRYVPFLFKQWGNYCPEKYNDDMPFSHLENGETSVVFGARDHRFYDGLRTFYRPKTQAGRLLDGRTHDGYPGTEEDES